MAIHQDTEPGKAAHPKEAELTMVCMGHMEGERFMYLGRW